MNLPAPVQPILAKTAVDDFLGSAQWQQRILDYGWELQRHDDLTLVARLPVRTSAGESDCFTLRVSCDFYPSHPPDVRFVNPDTLDYQPGRDTVHLPQLHAPYCSIHPTYQGFPPGFPYGPQLVCSSMTLGYYFSGHRPTADQAWRAGRDSIGSSLFVVHKALHSTHYQGRYGSTGR